jgi:hypothetical protein
MPSLGFVVKPHPRIRKTVKWGGAVVTLLLVVVWIGSGWWGVAYHGRAAEVLVERGGCLVSVWNREWRRSFTVWSHGPPFPHAWIWRSRVFSTVMGNSFLVPLWIPTTITLAISAAAWWPEAHTWLRARRREKAASLNLCPKCNYDRAGLAKEAVCPECGASGRSARP